MPTTKPRLAVTLTPEARATLNRLARVTKQPASRIVTEVVEAALPVLEQTASTMEALQFKTATLSAELRRSFGQAERTASRQALAMLDVLAEAEHQLRNEPAPITPETAEGGDGPAGAAPSNSGPRNPRSSNTGVANPGNRQKRTKKGQK